MPIMSEQRSEIYFSITVFSQVLF